MQVSFLSRSYLEFLAGYEIMTIPTYLAIGISRRNKYPPLTFIALGELSTVLVLSGFIYAYMETGSFYFSPLISILPLVLTSIGFMIRMGTFPFFSTEWVPITYGDTPPNLSEIISPSMTLVGVYGITRMALLSPPDLLLGSALVSLGSLTAVLGAFYSYINENVKSIFSFSTIENDGTILAVISLYVLHPDPLISSFALATLIVYSSAHSLAKTGLFLSIGLLEGQSKEPFREELLSTVSVLLLVSSMSGLLPTIGGVPTWATLEMFFMYAYVLHSAVSILPIFVGTLIAIGEGFATSTMVKYAFLIWQLREARGGEPREFRKTLIVLVVGIIVLFPGSLSVPSVYRAFTSGSSLGVP